MESEADKIFRSALAADLASFGLDELDDEQVERLAAHYSLLRRWNRRLNLTRILEPRDAARLHYAESLFGVPHIGDARSILDIGSGAGFPAIPLAVARPEVEVTALEANQKKAVFLSEAKDELALPNLVVARARLEDFDLKKYELLTSRALDRAEQLLTPVVARLEPQQKMLLYCAATLISKLNKPAPTEVHQIPLSENRVVALFSRS